MKIRMTAAWLLSLFTAGMLLLCGCGGGGASDEEPALGGRDSITMISEAQREIAKISSAAIVVFASGARRIAETMTSPEETEVWDFIAVQTEGAERSWDMRCDGGQWSIREREEMPAGIAFLDLTGVWMDVDAAWTLVEQEEMARPFLRWDLREAADPDARPLFVFAKSGGGGIYVNAISGQVFED